MTTAVCILVFRREVVLTNCLNMNKMLIVLLAVCLASTPALGKRQKAAENYWTTFQKKFQEFSRNFNNQVALAFDRKTMRNNWNNFSQKVNTIISHMKG